MYKFDNNYDFS